jgi:N-acetylmuramoyl-L-alanine amidase CwlA
MTAKYITIHNTANDASARNELVYMRDNNNVTSFHVAVDDVQALQGIPFNRNAWHAGDGEDGTGNRESIAIEICYSKSGGAKYNKAVENAVEIVARIMKAQGIPASNIRYHKNWSGKNCPHRLIADGVTLEKFQQRVQAKYNELFNKPTAPQNSVIYQIVTGSFTGKQNAAERAKELKNKGFDSFLQIKNINGVMYYQVVTGSFAQKRNATNRAQALKNKGFDSFLQVKK